MSQTAFSFQSAMTSELPRRKPLSHKHPRLTNRGLMATVLIASMLLTGCPQSIADKALPAPIRDQVEHEMVGEICKAWGGDNFEFGSRQALHYIVIRGIASPKPGQRFYQQARDKLYELTNDRQLKIKVCDRDRLMREIADVFVVNDPATVDQEELNIGLELIRYGFAWYNETEFEGSQQYRQAHEYAKQNRLGLWSLEDPISPLEFEQQQH